METNLKDQMQGDAELSLPEKVALIHNIKIRQAERWGRLIYWHNCKQFRMPTRHMFMQKEIDLLRQQKYRLFKLKQQVEQ